MLILSKATFVRGTPDLTTITVTIFLSDPLARSFQLTHDQIQQAPSASSSSCQRVLGGTWKLQSESDGDRESWRSSCRKGGIGDHVVGCDIKSESVSLGVPTLLRMTPAVTSGVRYRIIIIRKPLLTLRHPRFCESSGLVAAASRFQRP